jgi:hypothetical protein
MLLLVISVALFALKAFALADCVGRKPGEFVVLNTMQKSGWLVILGLGLGVHLLWWYPLSLLNLVGTVAAAVYLAQVRGSS